MAERVVIADLDFGDTGTNRVLGETTQKVAGLEAQTARTANVFTDRMFSMRHAAIAFLGSFTLAGAIFALKNFAEEVIKSAGAFGAFAAKREETSKSIKAFLVDIFHVNEGLQSMTSWMDRFLFLGQKIGVLGNEQGERGIIGKYLFGATAPHVMFELIEAAGRLIDKASGRQEAKPFVGPPAPPGIGNEPRFAPALDARIAKYNELVIAMEGAFHGAMNLGEAIGFADGKVEEITVNQFTAVTAFAHLSTTLDEVAAAGTAAGAAIGQGFASGFGNAKRALGTFLQLLAVIAYGRVATYTAAATASTTGLGAIVEGGTPAQFAASAAMWKRVAVIASIGGAFFSALGNAPEGGSGLGRQPGAAFAVAQTRQPANITLIVEGNVIGQDQWIRDSLIPDIQKAVSDGAA